MPIAQVHTFKRPDAATSADLLRRAVVAYMQAGGGMPDASRSGVRMLKGLGYVVLWDAGGDVVAVYRIRPDNLALRRMKRWPAMVTRR